MTDEVEEVKTEVKKEKKTTPSKDAEEEAFNKEYDLDNYDEDDTSTAQGASSLFGIGDLISHADPRDDPYVADPNLDGDESDEEDFIIKPTDNLLLAGHVEGDASTLEVYGIY